MQICRKNAVFVGFRSKIACYGFFTRSIPVENQKMQFLQLSVKNRLLRIGSKKTPHKLWYEYAKNRHEETLISFAVENRLLRIEKHPINNHKEFLYGSKKHPTSCDMNNTSCDMNVRKIGITLSKIACYNFSLMIFHTFYPECCRLALKVISGPLKYTSLIH